MNLEKLNQWLLLFSHLGILGGLILVGLQIRQDSEIAKAHLFSDITTSRMEMAGVTLGENPAPIVAKSLSEPETLTPAELLVMDAYYIRAINEARRSLVLKEVGLDLGIGAAENIIQFYFGSEIAQSWWRVFVSSHDADAVLRDLDRLVRSAGKQFTLSR
ncbi:MAG: hypothetical protein JRH16_12880, partial [Deltaproteobacteria bacterium]|nr:hypothetical protein [Deltaproteobacteria bacterium]